MATKKTEVVEIRPVKMDVVKVKIVGDTPLIVHAWSFKALMELFMPPHLRFYSAVPYYIPLPPVTQGGLKLT